MYLQCKLSLLWLFLHLENKGGNTLVTGSYLLDRKSELLGCSNRYWWDIYPIKLNYALFISFPPLETGSWWITNAWLLAKGRMGRAFSFPGQYILGTQKSLRQFVETVGVRFLGSQDFVSFIWRLTQPLVSAHGPSSPCFIKAHGYGIFNIYTDLLWYWFSEIPRQTMHPAHLFTLHLCSSVHSPGCDVVC